MSHADTGTADQASTASVVAFLRALAAKVEGDARFAATVKACLVESGLLAGDASKGRDDVGARASTGRKTARTRAPESSASDAPDPFAIYRAQGETGLRAALATLELVTLRVIVRTGRLDPARISARWTARERVIELIVSQVKHERITVALLSACERV